MGFAKWIHSGSRSSQMETALSAGMYAISNADDIGSAPSRTPPSDSSFRTIANGPFVSLAKLWFDQRDSPLGNMVQSGRPDQQDPPAEEGDDTSQRNQRNIAETERRERDSLLSDLVDARRTTNRYQEAPEMERAVAECWASREGNTLMHVTVQTRDGGKDFVGTHYGELTYGEVKHWKRPVDRHVLEEAYSVARADGARFVIGVTGEGGLTEPAKQLADEEGIEVITADDLQSSWYERLFEWVVTNPKKAGTLARNAVGRVRNGVGRVRVLVSSLWSKLTYVVKNPRVWWMGLSLFKKIITGCLVVGLVIGLLAYGRKRYRESDADTVGEWLRDGLRQFSVEFRFAFVTPG